MDDRPDPVAAAEALIAEMFGSAVWAVLSGSVITVARTPGSDLDIVVRLPDNATEPARRESLWWQGWPVELFVHSAASLRHYLAADEDRRRPTLVRMVAAGHLLIDVDGSGAAESRRCRRILDAGPPPLSQAQRDSLRYLLTDQLDDVRSALDPDERLVASASLWEASASALLDARGRWRGAGKWLLRELRAADEAFARRWLASRFDPEAVCVLAEEALSELGGPLFAGHRVLAAVD